MDSQRHASWKPLRWKARPCCTSPARCLRLKRKGRKRRGAKDKKATPVPRQPKLRSSGRRRTGGSSGLKVNGRQRRSGNTSLESGTRESADRVSRVTVRAGGSTPRAGNTEANGAVLLVQAATVRSAPEVVSSGEMSGSAVRFAGKEKPARGRSSRSHGMKSAARGRPGRLVAVAEAGKLPPVAVIRPTSVAALLKASAAERRIASFVDANAGRSVADSVNAIAANAVRKGRDPMVRAHARTGAN